MPFDTTAALAALDSPIVDGIALTALDVIATAAVGIVLSLSYLLLATPRYRAAADPLAHDELPLLGAMRAQSLYERIARRLGPAAVAAVVTLGHTHSVGAAVIVFGAMVAAASALWDPSHPLQLTTLARIAFDLLMPLAGITLALLLESLGNFGLSGDVMVLPLLAAWTITLLSAWLEQSFDDKRPIRIGVLGPAALAAALQQEMDQNDVRGYRILGYISEGPAVPNGKPAPLGTARLGTLEDLRGAVLEYDIDLLLVAPRGSRLDLFRRVADTCLDLPVRMLEASAFYEQLHGRVPIGTINDAWFQYMLHPSYAPTSAHSKRTVDLVLSGITLVAILPLLGMLALAVRLSDGGPAFYRQRRIGEGGREFEVLKLRTMRIDAEHPGRPTWATRDDARVTTVGRFLRKTHLDELPQLVNVLKGEMSLVGPRPERPAFVAELEGHVPHYRRRHLVKPGVTGWAQVQSGYGGTHLGTAAKVSHDLYYIKHRSLLFDLLIITETARMLFTDHQYATFTFSEAFILGEQMPREESALLQEAASVVSS